jgi:ferredoxin-like protein FixX
VSGQGQPARVREARCVECGRVFDLSDGSQAEEWFFGHDCEA